MLLEADRDFELAKGFLTATFRCLLDNYRFAKSYLQESFEGLSREVREFLISSRSLPRLAPL